MTKLAVPSPQDVRDRLSELSRRARARLSQDSGVPADTLKRIRLGVIDDPRLGLVHKLWPHLGRVKKL